MASERQHVGGEISFSDLYLPNPDVPEWDPPKEHELEAMIAGEDMLVSPKGWALRRGMAKSRWFLVKNVEGFTAKGQMRPAMYFTKHGVERPFQGLESIFGIFVDQAEKYIELLEDPDVDALTLAQELFRRAWKIGAIEPIGRRKAIELNTRIMRRGGFRDLKRTGVLAMVKVKILRIPGGPRGSLTIPPSRRGRKPRKLVVGDTAVITTAQAESLEQQGVKIEIVDETAEQRKREAQARAAAVATEGKESLGEAKARTKRSRARQPISDGDDGPLAIETGDEDN